MRYPLHVEINARFDLDIDSDKTLPLAVLGEFITEQDIESRLLEALVESLNEQLVEAYCGEKHAHGNAGTNVSNAPAPMTAQPSLLLEETHRAHP